PARASPAPNRLRAISNFRAWRGCERVTVIRGPPGGKVPMAQCSATPHRPGSGVGTRSAASGCVTTREIHRNDFPFTFRSCETAPLDPVAERQRGVRRGSSGEGFRARSCLDGALSTALCGGPFGHAPFHFV